MLLLPASCLIQNLPTIRRILKRKLRMEILDNHRGETQHAKTNRLPLAIISSNFRITRTRNSGTFLPWLGMEVMDASCRPCECAGDQNLRPYPKVAKESRHVLENFPLAPATTPEAWNRAKESRARPKKKKGSHTSGEAFSARTHAI